MANLNIFNLSADVSEFEFDEFHDDNKEIEKDSALHQTILQLAGDFGRESMLSLQRFFQLMMCSCDIHSLIKA